MAIERLKFRCYRCNQLLGATPNKAGSVVTCPKCSAELLIPMPELRAGGGLGRPGSRRRPRRGRRSARTSAPPRPSPSSRLPPNRTPPPPPSRPPPRPAPAAAYRRRARGRASPGPDRPETGRPARRGRVFREPHAPARRVSRSRTRPWPPPEALAPAFAPRRTSRRRRTSTARRRAAAQAAAAQRCRSCLTRDGRPCPRGRPSGPSARRRPSAPRPP